VCDIGGGGLKVAYFALRNMWTTPKVQLSWSGASAS